MKSTNLNIFYHLGEALQSLDKLFIGMEFGELLMNLIQPETWLLFFLKETKEVPLPDTRKSAVQLLETVQSIINTVRGNVEPNWKRVLTQQEMISLQDSKSQFDSNFDREHRNIDVFTVLPKGIYDTRALIERPEEKFSVKARGFLPEQTLYDLKQAGRCLAFELPTCCAFHVCRGTEALMLEYYELLTGHAWKFPKRDWKIYVEQLIKEQSPKTITTRLEEIRLMDRNAYIHPDKNVTLDEAPVLFELCTGVIFQITQEMEKLKSREPDGKI